MTEPGDVVDIAWLGSSHFLGDAPNGDPLIKDLRELLRAHGYRSVARKLRTRRAAAIYFMGLVLPGSIDMPRVQRVLGVPKGETVSTITRLVLERKYPQYADRTDDVVAASRPFYLRGQTLAEILSAGRLFVSRVWTGVPAGSDEHAALVERASALLRLMVIRARLASASNMIEQPDASQLPESAWRAPAGWSAVRPVDLALLRGEGPAALDRETEKAVDFAIAFGVMLSNQIAFDVGVVPSGTWQDRVTVIGFCAALPAVADALAAHQLLESATLAALARRADAASGDGFLIETLAQLDDAYGFLSECCVAMKEALTADGVVVTDEVFAMFPMRLAASFDFATQVAAGDGSSPFE